MKQFFLLSAALAVVLAGCGPKTDAVVAPNGGKTIAAKPAGKTEAPPPSDNQAAPAHEEGTVPETGGKDEPTTTASVVSEADLGLPFYPGSEEQKTDSMISSGADGKDVRSVRTTKDDPGKVRDFYKNKISNASLSNMESNGTKMVIMSGKLKGSDVMISVAKTRDEDTRISIAITYKKGK
ncbi:MAG TPA: hypothetical protein VHE55_09280 [Fimbriimonadaceae bacterium]|nr:hypothetical protein [Fimbriimonadaceae bacterium]